MPTHQPDFPFLSGCSMFLFLWNCWSNMPQDSKAPHRVEGLHPQSITSCVSQHSSGLAHIVVCKYWYGCQQIPLMCSLYCVVCYFKPRSSSTQRKALPVFFFRTAITLWSSRHTVSMTCCVLSCRYSLSFSIQCSMLTRFPLLHTISNTLLTKTHFHRQGPAVTCLQLVCRWHTLWVGEF